MFLKVCSNIFCHSLRIGPQRSALSAKKHPQQHDGNHQPHHPAQAAALAGVVQPLAVGQAGARYTHRASGFAILEVNRRTGAAHRPGGAALAQVQGEPFEDADALLETETHGVSSLSWWLGRRFVRHYGWRWAQLASLVGAFVVSPISGWGLGARLVLSKLHSAGPGGSGWIDCWLLPAQSGDSQ